MPADSSWKMPKVLASVSSWKVLRIVERKPVGIERDPAPFLDQGGGGADHGQAS